MGWVHSLNWHRAKLMQHDAPHILPYSVLWKTILENILLHFQFPTWTLRNFLPTFYCLVWRCVCGVWCYAFLWVILLFDVTSHKKKWYLCSVNEQSNNFLGCCCYWYSGEEYTWHTVDLAWTQPHHAKIVHFHASMHQRMVLSVALMGMSTNQLVKWSLKRVGMYQTQRNLCLYVIVSQNGKECFIFLSFGKNVILQFLFSSSSRCFSKINCTTRG